jgi:hypothetical protein
MDQEEDADPVAERHGALGGIARASWHPGLRCRRGQARAPPGCPASRSGPSGTGWQGAGLLIGCRGARIGGYPPLKADIKSPEAGQDLSQVVPCAAECYPL